MIKEYSKKVTPKQFAEKAVLDKLINLKEYWAYYYRADVDAMSDKEKQAIEDHIQESVARVCKYFGDKEETNG